MILAAEFDPFATLPAGAVELVSNGHGGWNLMIRVYGLKIAECDEIMQALATGHSPHHAGVWRLLPSEPPGHLKAVLQKGTPLEGAETKSLLDLTVFEAPLSHILDSDSTLACLAAFLFKEL